MAVTPVCITDSLAPAVRRRGRARVGSAALSIAVVSAVFGFAVPQLASYRGVWADLSSVPWPRAALVAAAVAVQLVVSWAMITAIVPSLRLREAAVLNLGSAAVAHTLPAGGALAVGLRWAMMSGWGIGRGQFALYTLVSEIWNTVIRLSMPVVVVVIVLAAGEPAAGLAAGAITGLALLAAGAVGGCLALRADCGRLVRALERLIAAVFRLARRPAPQRLGPALADLRRQGSSLHAARGLRIAATTVMTHILLAVILLICLWACGLTQEQVPWPAALAAFAFARLVSVLPVTPGGAGVVELALIGYLAAGLDDAALTKVTAAVLLYRAVTYLLPALLGAAAFLIWRCTPAWRLGSPAADSHAPRPRTAEA